MAEFSIRRFLLPKGRTDRRAFLVVVVTISILWQLPEFVVTDMLMHQMTVYAWQDTTARLGFCLLAWPLMCAAARRLHDIRLPAWPAFIYLWRPFIEIMAAMNNHFGSSARLAPGVYTNADLIILAASVLLCLIPGSKGDNRYGPPPRGPQAPTADVF